LASGGVVLNTTPGWSYAIRAVLSFEATQNEVLEFAILRDGVPSFFRPDISGVGNQRPVSVQLIDNILASASDELIQVGCRAIDGNATMDVQDAALEVVILPTNNPTAVV
jgi:hypothetical protein